MLELGDTEADGEIEELTELLGETEADGEIDKEIDELGETVVLGEIEELGDTDLLIL